MRGLADNDERVPITGRQLKDARHRARLTQPQAARLLGIPPRTYEGWESRGVPRGKEVLVEELLLTDNGPLALARFSDEELVYEIGRRLAKYAREHQELRDQQADAGIRTDSSDPEQLDPPIPGAKIGRGPRRATKGDHAPRTGEVRPND